MVAWIRSIVQKFSSVKLTGVSRSPAIQAAPSSIPATPNSPAHRPSLTELQQEFDLLTSVVKRLGLWSVVWGQGMALWFFHQAGYQPPSLVAFTLISVESIAIMAVSAGILIFFDLVPLILVLLISTDTRLKLVRNLVYPVLTLGYGVMVGRTVYVFNDNWTPAIFAGLITTGLNLLLFYARDIRKSRFVLYAPFVVPPALLFLFIAVPSLPSEVMSYIGELQTPRELLVSKKYKLISKVGFACKLDSIPSPSPLYYAFSGAAEIAPQKGLVFVNIPGTIPIKCSFTSNIPEKYLLTYNPPPPVTPKTPTPAPAPKARA